MSSEEFKSLEAAYSEYDADFIVISGYVGRDLARKLAMALESKHGDSRPHVCLFLTTYGGDADGAYIITRTLKRKYDHFSLFISSFCKSAGTLISLGADEIVMFPNGEFGPLDVQWQKEDTLGNYGSGLDITDAITSLSNHAFEIFENFFLNIMRRGRGAISTKTAMQIASENAIGLVSPLTGQLDPLKIGEIQRAMDVAYKYGIRLGASPSVLRHLIQHYPSHSFVIDFEEAKELFDRVRSPSDLDIEIESQLGSMLENTYGMDYLAEPPYDEAILVVMEEGEEDELDEDPGFLEEDEDDLSEDPGFLEEDEDDLNEDPGSFEEDENDS